MSRADDNELAFAGPIRLAKLVRERELSARELVDLFLTRIDRIDPRVGAFRLTLPDEAYAAASRIDAGPIEGSGPLTGVPIAVKDDMPYGGHEMTRGSRSPAQRQASDAEALRRLRAAGAIPLGITNVPELMLFPWTASDANAGHAQPVGSDAHAGWLLGRFGGGTRGRAGRRRRSLRRRRLDPDPCRLLRPGRDEAHTWASFLAAAAVGMARAGHLRSTRTDGGRQRPAARLDARPRAR